MMIPPKLQHGDNLGNLFEKFNTVIDYLREIRLVAGNGIRINRMAAGTTIESTAAAASVPPSNQNSVWIAKVEKNYHVDYWGTMPWAVLFYNARTVFHGVMQDGMLPLYLNNAAVSAGTLYVYAIDLNFVDKPALRWSTVPLWDHSIIGSSHDYLPIRYICKITINDENLQFDRLPTDTVYFQGGQNDPIRLVAQWSTRTWNQDLKDSLEPCVIYRGSILHSNPVTGAFNAEEITQDHIELANYSSLGNVVNIIASTGSISAIPSASVLGGYGFYRPIARLGKEDDLGFRPIIWSDPIYSVYEPSNGFAFNGNYIKLTQKYINKSGEIKSVNKIDIDPTGWTDPVTVYADFDYNPANNSMSTVRLRLSTESTDNPSTGYTRLTYNVGTIIPAEIGVAKGIMYYPVIAPGFASLRAEFIYSDYGTRLSDLNLSVTNLDQRVTALENQ